eukprot:Clim_evm3s19 gene=Clim_evmTU3s19
MASMLGCLFATEAPEVQYAAPVTEAKEGETAVYRPAPKLLSCGFMRNGKEVRDMGTAFNLSVKEFAEQPCIGKRRMISEGKYSDFEFITYAETGKLVDDFAAAIDLLDLCPIADENDKHLPRKLGFYCKNRMEFYIAEMAAARHGIAIVPLYDTLGDDTISYVVNQTNMTTILVSTENFRVVSAFKKSDVPTLKNVIELRTDGMEPCGSLEGFEVRQWDDVMEAGRKHGSVQNLPIAKECDVYLLAYTSGTTGQPKGVLLPHSNILVCTYAMLDRIEYHPNDVHLSYLPMAHMFEQILMVSVINSGSCIGYFRGDTQGLLEDIAMLRPTTFPSVPRLWNRIYDRIMASVEAEGGVKKYLFDTALNSKRYWLKYGYFTHAVWDPLVFNKIKARLGLDRVRVTVTGSAPLAPHVIEFYRALFGSQMYEGYGQTETTAGVCVTTPDDVSTAGWVGGPVQCCEIKLVDVPDMNYTSKDKPYPRGEFCVRGANIFRGYYKMPEKTAETKDKDGWLHSGDIAELLPNGAVRLIDRKKNIFKLSQGEYVAAEKIENILTKAAPVSQMFIYGDSLQSHLVAIAVADEDTFLPWCERQGITMTKDSNPNTPDVHDALIKEFSRIGREHGLKGFELPKGVYVEKETWTPEDPEDKLVLTPTSKLRRPQARARYQAMIDDMYAKCKVAGQTGMKQSQMGHQ